MSSCSDGFIPPGSDPEDDDSALLVLAEPTEVDTLSPSSETVFNFSEPELESELELLLSALFTDSADVSTGSEGCSSTFFVVTLAATDKVPLLPAIIQISFGFLRSVPAWRWRLGRFEDRVGDY